MKKARLQTFTESVKINEAKNDIGIKGTNDLLMIVIEGMLGGLNTSTIDDGIKGAMFLAASYLGSMNKAMDELHGMLEELIHSDPTVAFDADEYDGGNGDVSKIEKKDYDKKIKDILKDVKKKLK